MTKITIHTLVDAPIDTVWTCFTQPEHITQWNFASDDWCCPWAKADLKPGGRYVARMEAKDGSFGFDFEATYDEVIPENRLRYTLTDGRIVVTEFMEVNQQVSVTTEFDAETENSPEAQRTGWQAILDNFKAHAEQQQ